MFYLQVVHSQFDFCSDIQCSIWFGSWATSSPLHIEGVNGSVCSNLLFLSTFLFLPYLSLSPPSLSPLFFLSPFFFPLSSSLVHSLSPFKPTTMCRHILGLNSKSLLDRNSAILTSPSCTHSILSFNNRSPETTDIHRRSQHEARGGNCLLLNFQIDNDFASFFRTRKWFKFQPITTIQFSFSKDVLLKLPNSYTEFRNFPRGNTPDLRFSLFRGGRSLLLLSENILKL